jgi:hypothetical protein
MAEEKTYEAERFGKMVSKEQIQTFLVDFSKSLKTTAGVK